MPHEIDINDWERKAHYLFFKDFSSPFLGITANLNCTRLKETTKRKGISLYLSYMHKSLLAANLIPEFCYRIVDGKVIYYEELSASPTIPRADNSFGFGYFPYHESFTEFAVTAKAEIERVGSRSDLEPATTAEGVIHYTTIPWLSFTQIVHPSHDGFKSSIPKIAFGKIFAQGSEFLMPVSVSGHHALMDGYHIGRFFEILQELFDSDI